MEKKFYPLEAVPSVIDGLPVVQDIEKAMHSLVDHKVPIARFEFGDSMRPILSSGQFCKITPIDNEEDIKIGDALFCEVNGYVGTHMVLLKSHIDEDKTWYLIGMTDMEPIGWTSNIFGIATAMNHYVRPHHQNATAFGRGRFFG